MNNFERKKANTIKWFKRSNPEAWFRINMGPQKWQEYLNEEAEKERKTRSKKLIILIIQYNFNLNKKIMLFQIFILLNLVEAIPFIKDELDLIKLYDYREIAFNEYELISTNLETNDLIDMLTPFPLSIDNDIYCENYINNIKVILISCHLE